MQINGVKLDDKQASYYEFVKKKNPALAKKFLDGLGKRQAQEKGAREDVMIRCRAEKSDISRLSTLDNQGVHNFSLGCLDAYFYLSDQIEDGGAYLFRDRILVLPAKGGGAGASFKVFVYRYDPADLDTLKEMQKAAIIYSIDQIPGLPGQNRFQEIAYEIEKVFDPAGYKSYQKRKEIIGRPLRRVLADGLTAEPITEANLGECRHLHERWVEYKLADPDTYQIMFPRKRYYYCAEKAAGMAKNPLGVAYEGIMFRMKGIPIAYDVGSIEGGCGYGFAGVGCYWDRPTHLMRGIDVWNLQHLLEKGVRQYNCGVSLNKSLSAFKTRYPHYLVESFMYSKLK